MAATHPKRKKKKGLQAAPAPAGKRVPMSEVLASLSHALDMTEGQPKGHSIRSCMIGMRLGEEAGLDPNQLAELYYALLLKDAGCSSNASRIAALFGSDDQYVKSRLKAVDWHNRRQLALETWHTMARGGTVWSRMLHFFGIAQQGDVTRQLIASRCERGGSIARRLGFPEGTAAAIQSLDEHWNGKGYPQGLQGDAIPPLSRIINLAQTIEVFLRKGDRDAAAEMVRARRGTWFEPELTDIARDMLSDDEWGETLRSPDADAPRPAARASHSREGGGRRRTRPDRGSVRGNHRRQVAVHGTALVHGRGIRAHHRAADGICAGRPPAPVSRGVVARHRKAGRVERASSTSRIASTAASLPRSRSTPGTRGRS